MPSAGNVFELGSHASTVALPGGKWMGDHAVSEACGSTPPRARAFLQRLYILTSQSER